MIKSAALAVLVAAETQAAIIGVVPLQSGAILRLHDEAGPCVDGALLIEYAAPGKPAINGCWSRKDNTIHAAFLDSDSVAFPVQVVRQPEAT